MTADTASARSAVNTRVVRTPRQRMFAPLDGEDSLDDTVPVLARQMIQHPADRRLRRRRVNVRGRDDDDFGGDFREWWVTK